MERAFDVKEEAHARARDDRLAKLNKAFNESRVKLLELQKLPELARLFSSSNTAIDHPNVTTGETAKTRANNSVRHTRKWCHHSEVLRKGASSGNQSETNDSSTTNKRSSQSIGNSKCEADDVTSTGQETLQQQQQRRRRPQQPSVAGTEMSTVSDQEASVRSLRIVRVESICPQHRVVQTQARQNGFALSDYDKANRMSQMQQRLCPNLASFVYHSGIQRYTYNQHFRYCVDSTATFRRETRTHRVSEPSYNVTRGQFWFPLTTNERQHASTTTAVGQRICSPQQNLRDQQNLLKRRSTIESYSDSSRLAKSKKPRIVA
ncbi:uncharacterized protein LOC134192363 [Corticium candelabrum]|uniref:uncharacterized protein LOC134192363 n=1 Tax=Corticium candelabrum TaxID=121492 RepID=UPI002E273A6B|nr:uncharacterized protein LOC134192363 [Corticium candelabrum]